MTGKIIEFIKNAWRVFRDESIPWSQKTARCFGRHYAFFLYLVVGGMTTVINLGIYYVMVNSFEVDPYVSTAAAWFFAMIFAFLVNKLWVFRDKSWLFKHAMYQFWTFAAARLLSLGFEELFMFIGIELCHFDENIIKLPIQVFVVLANYVASKLVIFRKSSGNT